MRFGVPGLKKALDCFFVGILFGVLLSCNNYNNTNPYTPYNGSSPPPLSSITLRAYVSNPVQPSISGVGGTPVLNIVDASTDILSPYTVALSSASASIGDPGVMALSPKQDRTLVSSPADSRIAIVSNSQNSVSSAVNLPGATESFFVWSDNTTAFAAVPSASTPGQPPGAVERIDLPSATITATIPVPGAHYILPSPNGSEILVFSDNSDDVTLVSPNLIGTNTQSNAQVPCSSTQMAACTISGFDRPTWAVFNGSSTTAYILNCGQQCGGVGAGPCLTFTSCTTVSGLDMTQSPPALVNSVALPAATTGLLQGNTLYVAGTPFLAADNSCAGVTTAATSCGRLTVVNVASMTAAAPLVITDGYHDRIQMGSNAQLFIGSRGCTNINTSSEVRGCLTIVNTSSASISSSSIIIPPDNGDVTGIEPIPDRTVVYICEGGNLRVYETTTDKLEVFQLPATGPNVTGQAIDVKVVDF